MSGQGIIVQTKRMQGLIDLQVSSYTLPLFP